MPSLNAAYANTRAPRAARPSVMLVVDRVSFPNSLPRVQTLGEAPMHHRVTSYRRPSIVHKPHVVLWALDSQARNQSVTSHAVLEYSQSRLPVQGLGYIALGLKCV